MTTINFSVPQRQSILACVFYFLLAIKNFITKLWPLLALYLIKDNLRELVQEYIWLSIPILLLTILHSYLSYLNFFFYIENEELILKEGYLRKKQTAIPFDKIVSINTKQGIIQQILGVVEVEVDSAGSKLTEIKIKALSKDIAQALDHHLSNNTKQENKEDSENTVEETKEIISLGYSQLFRVGITQNHFKGLLIIIAFVYNIYYQIKDFYEEELESTTIQAESFLEETNFTGLLIIVFLILCISLIVSMSISTLLYYELKLKELPKAFFLQSGLFNRRSVNIPFNRIQAITTQSNILQKLARISTITLSQSNSNINNKKSTSVKIPGCETKHTKHIEQLIFRKDFADFVALKPNSIFLRRQIIWLAIIPALISLILIHFSLMYIFISLSLLLFGIYISILNFKKRKFLYNSDFLIINKGLFSNLSTTIEYYKIQGISLKQSYFQRRRKVADLFISVAGSSITCTDIDIN